MICPHCHRTISEQQRYLMSADPEKPGLLDCLRGEAGDGWRPSAGAAYRRPGIATPAPRS
jgi:hypothetical protein